MNQRHKTLEEWFKHDQSNSTQVLERARLCAALTRPWILPPDGQTESTELPETYQSLGAAGVRNLGGNLLSTLFPPGQPWFRFLAKPEWWYDPEIPDEDKSRFAERLFLWDLLSQAKLESTPLGGGRIRRRSTFQSHKSRAIDQIVVTGDALEMMTDDYRHKLFRRDQYVTKRDSSTDVMYHIIRECVDPHALSDDIRRAAKLDPDQLNSENPSEREADIYTMVRYEPMSNKWLVRQEINEHVVAESDESVSQYFSTATYLVPGENYGRGIIEDNLGDLKSLNELEKRLLDMAGLASKANPVLDSRSEIRPKDLEKPSGELIIGGRVNNGVVDDVGWLGYDKVREMQMLTATTDRKQGSLSDALLIESQMGSPDGRDRVTRFERTRVAMEKNASISGILAPLAEDQQLPLLARLEFQLKRDKLLPPLPGDAVEVTTLTGVTQIAQQERAGKLLTLAQVAQALGEEAMAAVDTGEMLSAYQRLEGLYEPGIIKTREQRDAETQAKQAAEQQQIVTQGATDAAVNVATEAAKQTFAPQ